MGDADELPEEALQALDAEPAPPSTACHEPASNSPGS